jgi:hypothetical protein
MVAEVAIGAAQHVDQSYRGRAIEGVTWTIATHEMPDLNF